MDEILEHSLWPYTQITHANYSNSCELLSGPDSPCALHMLAATNEHELIG